MVYYLLVGGGKCFFVAESVIKIQTNHILQKRKALAKSAGAKVQKKLIYERKGLAYK